MNDLISVALISAGSAVAVSLITQWLTIRAANKQRDHQERLEERRLQQAEAVRKEALHDERLHELFGHALTAQWLMFDIIEQQGNSATKAPSSSALEWPASAAGRAYAIALTGIAAAIPAAKRYYTAIATLQRTIQNGDNKRVREAIGEFHLAMDELEACVASLAQHEQNETS